MKTQTRERIVFFIIEYRKANGYSPTWEEIRVGVGLKSKSTVGYHMQNLRSDGQVSYENGLPRTLVVNDRSAKNDTSG